MFLKKRLFESHKIHAMSNKNFIIVFMMEAEKNLEVNLTYSALRPTITFETVEVIEVIHQM